MKERNIAIVIVENSFGFLHVHKKASNKKMFPSMYGLGAGGKINDGEDPKNAAKRELKEELGIADYLANLVTLEFFSRDFNDRIYVFRTKHDGKVKPCTREFQWSGWLCRQSVDYLAAENLLCYDINLAYNFYKLFCND
ncbi:NUDIX domain-containing protein [Candidatus Woesearchaeota archaeon]|nr:NUDIX domain-containing protein [Candidatus Woesearchaeota archaeon]